MSRYVATPTLPRPLPALPGAGAGRRPLARVGSLVSVGLALASLSVFARVVPLPPSASEFLLPSDIAWGALVALALARGCLSGRFPLRLPALTRRPLLVLSALVAFGTVITFLERARGGGFLSPGVWGPPALYFARYLLTIGALALAYAHFSRRRAAVSGARTLLLAGLAVGGMVLGQLVGLIPDIHPQRHFSWAHVGPLSPHKGHLAGYMLILIGLVLQLRLSPWLRFPRRFLDLTLVVCISGVLISNRRSGWVAMLLLFGLAATLILFQRGKRRRRWAAVSAVGAALLVSALILVQPALRSSADDVFQFDAMRARPGGNLEFRFHASVGYLRYFVEHRVNPLWGAGFASTSTQYLAGYGGTHNQLLTWFFELGILGLAAYVWLVVAMFRRLYRTARPAGAAGLVAISTLVALNVYSLPGAIFYYGTLFGNLTVLYLAYFALSLRLLELGTAGGTGGGGGNGNGSVSVRARGNRSPRP